MLTHSPLLPLRLSGLPLRLLLCPHRYGYRAMPQHRLHLHNYAPTPSLKGLDHILRYAAAITPLLRRTLPPSYAYPTHTQHLRLKMGQKSWWVNTYCTPPYAPLMGTVAELNDGGGLGCKSVTLRTTDIMSNFGG